MGAVRAYECPFAGLVCQVRPPWADEAPQASTAAKSIGVGFMVLFLSTGRPPRGGMLPWLAGCNRWIGLVLGVRRCERVGMATYFNSILSEVGIDPAGVRLLRHQDDEAARR